jgi:predicted acyltransferase
MAIQQSLAPPLENPTQRILSLDVFRGATIAAMLLVNNPGDWGSIYAPFEHAKWNGWTFTDVIFPFFLWIVGVAMTLSFTKRIGRGVSRKNLALHSVKRSVILFALGLFLTGFPFGLLFGDHFSLATWRIPGVLQRIALCSLLASFAYLYTSTRSQILITAVLLAAYWLLVSLVPVPGYGAGILEPKGCLCWYVDSNLLGGHTWIWAPTPGFDPEGIVSTIPAIATTMFGIFTGCFLQSARSQEEKTAWMFVAGNALLLVGTVMDNWLPINKNMWTSPYAVFMAGLALNVFACCYWLFDVRGVRRATSFFAAFGLNAISIYVVSEFLGKVVDLISWQTSGGKPATLKGIVYENVYASWLAPRNASLLFALSWTLAMFAFAYAMFKRRLVVKL